MRKIIITGGSGFLGTQIIRKLLTIGGCQIVVMDIVPPRIQHDQIVYVEKNLMESFELDKDYQELQNPDTVIHLSGKNIFGRFTQKHKQLIADTRIIGTRNLVQLFRRPLYRPRKLIAASAVGFYGDQGQDFISETSEPGNYFYLSGVVQKWEAENLQALGFDIEVCCIRNAHILGAGGLLQENTSYFKYGIGAILGSGNDFLPWIDIRDLVDLYIQCIDISTPTIVNGVNGVVTTQKEFAYAIGRIKKTFFYIRVYQWMLSVLFSGFAKEILISQKIISKYHTDINFQPQHTDIHQVIEYYIS